jgi:hypothetical protein
MKSLVTTVSMVLLISSAMARDCVEYKADGSTQRIRCNQFQIPSARQSVNDSLEMVITRRHAQERLFREIKLDGEKGGNGAFTVVCRDDRTSRLTSVKLLDLFEGQHFHRLSYPSQPTSVDQRITRALRKLSNYPQLVRKINNDIFFIRQNITAVPANQIIQSHNMHANHPGPTVQNYVAEVVLPRNNCQIEQLFNYNRHELQINRDLAPKVDDLNFAATLLHEAISLSVRENFKFRDQVELRALVATLMSTSDDLRSFEPMLDYLEQSLALKIKLRPGFGY